MLNQSNLHFIRLKNYFLKSCFSEDRFLFVSIQLFQPVDYARNYDWPGINNKPHFRSVGGKASSSQRKPSVANNSSSKTEAKLLVGDENSLLENLEDVNKVLEEDLKQNIKVKREREQERERQKY